MEIKIKIKTEELIDPPIFNSREEAIEWLESAEYLDDESNENKD